MYNKRTLSIWICCCWLVAFASTVPVDVARCKPLGHTFSQITNSSQYQVQTMDDAVAIESTTGVPQFEYALLGQDPEDQHWYRVSLTPTNGNTGYRAQFATRKTPPYDSEQAHKHDKTIQDMLNFLEKSEQHNLVRVYSQLLSDEEKENKMKRNVNTKLQLEGDNDVDPKSHPNAHRSQLLTEDLSETTPAVKQDRCKTTFVKRLTKFVKGLK